MKRYILVAIVALLGLTSCVIESGNTPAEDAAAKRLYYTASNMLELHAIAHCPKIIYADALIREDAAAIEILKKDEFNNYTTEIGEDGVKIIHANGTMTVKTGGKALEEGGVWQLFFYDNTYPTYTCTGVVGQQRAFTVMSTKSDESVNVSVSYRVAEDNNIFISFSGSGLKDNDDYSLSFSIDEQSPITYRHKNLYLPIFGTMQMDYHDKNSGKRLSAKATAKLNSTEYEYI